MRALRVFVCARAYAVYQPLTQPIYDLHTLERTPVYIEKIYLGEGLVDSRVQNFIYTSMVYASPTRAFTGSLLP